MAAERAAHDGKARQMAARIRDPAGPFCLHASAAGKNGEVIAVAEQLDTLLDKLRGNVKAMREILTRPSSPPGDGENDERRVPQ